FDAPEFVQAETQGQQFSVPRDFITLCKTAFLYRDSSRFGLLYRLIWRLREVPRLLQVSFDPDVAKANTVAQAVRRDLHKMKAFVRFREIEGEDGEPCFVAWFEPSHYIVEALASFFTGRFTNMRWSILTPDLCMHWDGETLSYSPGASKADAPAEDAGEDLWRAYYRSIFNPARLKVSAMQAQMPKKYWRNLPEADLIAELVISADNRKEAMIAAQPTEPQRKIVKYVVEKEDVMPPRNASDPMQALRDLNAEMLTLVEYPLAAQATQAVFGAGSVPAKIMLLGEQPGDQEDLAGQPFVGPAGRLLDQALQEAGIDRSCIYVTNTVKHFKFTMMRNRRQHRSPDVRDIQLYLPWLKGEIEIVQPQVIIALGAVAARALAGKALGLEANRGKLLELTNGRQVVLTYHPSFLLRTPDKETKQLRYERLVADLKLAAKAAAST
ncbi:MAG TPA: UdgX family uracil-DNA binding protein, partial [Methylophilaceae bacterium]|nr:UdgX family uracil-DNA binding protein [Methylophilaceae bacterium]